MACMKAYDRSSIDLTKILSEDPAPSWLLHASPMSLHRFRYSAALPEVLGHFVIGIYLRLYEVERLLGQALRNAHHAVQIANQDVSRVDDCFLIFAVQAHWHINLGSQVSHVCEARGEHTVLR